MWVYAVVNCENNWSEAKSCLPDCRGTNGLFPLIDPYLHLHLFSKLLLLFLLFFKFLEFNFITANSHLRSSWLTWPIISQWQVNKDDTSTISSCQYKICCETDGFYEWGDHEFTAVRCMSAALFSWFNKCLMDCCLTNRLHSGLSVKEEFCDLRIILTKFFDYFKEHLHVWTDISMHISRVELSINRFIFIPTLTYGHGLWVLSDRTRSGIQNEFPS